MGLKSALIWFGLGRDISPLLPGIDSGHSWFKIKPIAVEAFGLHLKGADASVPFSFGGFSEIPEKPRVRSEPIPFLYPLGVSAER